MAESKLEKYIRRDIRSADAFRHPEVTQPVLGIISDAHLGNNNFRIAWWPIAQPLLMITQTHLHDSDQYLMFFGGDATNLLDLGGEVELTLGETSDKLEKFVFTTGTMVYIRKGLLHGPLYFRKIYNPAKPILFMDLFHHPFSH